jgi:hypothetical protein
MQDDAVGIGEIAQGSPDCSIAVVELTPQSIQDRFASTVAASPGHE